MSMLPPPKWVEDFKKWGVFDEDGDIVGIREDAPADVQASFDAMQETYAKAEEKNIIL